MEKKAKTEIDSNKEAKKLQGEKEELGRKETQIRERIDQIENDTYKRHKIPRSEWTYREQLQKEEYERHEKALQSLLTQQEGEQE